MSGIIYEIQNRRLQSFKHTFDYQFCKKKYNEYASMGLEEFSKCLSNSKTLGEIGHLICFIMWIKNEPQYKYRDALGDWGIIHLLFHCLEFGEDQIELHSEYIHEIFKEDIELK